MGEANCSWSELSLHRGSSYSSLSGGEQGPRVRASLCAASWRYGRHMEAHRRRHGSPAAPWEVAPPLPLKLEARPPLELEVRAAAWRSNCPLKVPPPPPWKSIQPPLEVRPPLELEVRAAAWSWRSGCPQSWRSAPPPPRSRAATAMEVRPEGSDPNRAPWSGLAPPLPLPQAAGARRS